MDPRTNPYSPGAGSPPPELAGRDDLIERAAISIDRIRNGLATKSLLMVGLRGVGKTVLLNRIRLDADARGISTVFIEAPERKSLPALLSGPVRAALLKLDRIQNAGDKAKRALRVLGGLIKAAKFEYTDVEFHFDLGSEPGLGDTGDLDNDLGDLLQAIGEAASERRTAFAIFIDELQYVEEEQLAALITALHRCAQSKLPVTLIGAGLPQLIGNMGKAKSYAERLFDFPSVGPLSEEAGKAAIVVPARKLGIEYQDEAVRMILADTQAYPYFLQEWGKHSWDVASGSPITEKNVDDARRSALVELDMSFFRVRFDRLTPAEKRYLRAMANLGPGSHRSGDIATDLQVTVQSVAPTRSSLIAKGMIYSPSHGETAFTVPLFDEFMKRAMPHE
ncbi:MAG TPA: ATP-binding protein [Tepidisphaeraceae bacterium]|jgi:hypothetical protein|nr:ATP-binding protein [Tepidisphaeraceae bacterium]